MLAVAETIVVWLIIGRDPVVFFDKFPIRPELTVMKPEGLRLGVRINIGGGSLGAGIFGADRDAALWPDHVFYKEGGLAHHRTPACFIPTHTAVFKSNLQVAVVDFPFWKFIAEARADPAHADRLTASHLAHDIHVMHAAIDDR